MHSLYSRNKPSTCDINLVHSNTNLDSWQSTLNMSKIRLHTTAGNQLNSWVWMCRVAKQKLSWSFWMGHAKSPLKLAIFCVVSLGHLASWGQNSYRLSPNLIDLESSMVDNVTWSTFNHLKLNYSRVASPCCILGDCDGCGSRDPTATEVRSNNFLDAFIFLSVCQKKHLGYRILYNSHVVPLCF